MPGFGWDYKVPMSDSVDSNVPLVSSWGQAVPGTTQVPHVEVQTIFIEWNPERICKWQSNVAKLVPKPKTPDN